MWQDEDLITKSNQASTDIVSDPTFEVMGNAITVLLEHAEMTIS